MKAIIAMQRGKGTSMARRVGRAVPPILFIVAMLAISADTASAQTTPSATIKYDGAGRISTTLYTDQTCVVNKYNAQGNRTDVAVTKADAPETSVWGAGAWGCSKWDHP